MGKITHLSTHTDGQRRDGGTDDEMHGFRGGFIGRLQGRLHRAELREASSFF
jgi:hypothetical protein